MATRVTDPRKPLGQAIKHQRLMRAMTQEQLAEAADLQWTYISGIEPGIRNGTIVNLFHIAAGSESARETFGERVVRSEIT